MAHLIWVGEHPIEYFTALQFISFAICAYFARRITISNARPVAWAFARSAVADVAY